MLLRRSVARFCCVRVKCFRSLKDDVENGNPQRICIVFIFATSPPPWPDPLEHGGLRSSSNMGVQPHLDGAAMAGAFKLYVYLDVR